MIGPGYLEDNLEHGAPLPERVKETFHLLRELDVATRLLTTRADTLIGATEGMPREDRDEEEEEEDEDDGEEEKEDQKGGKKRKTPTPKGKKKEGGGGGGGEEDAASKRATLRQLQHAALRCADEKIALAIHAYDLVDTQIRHIDSDLRRFERHYGYIPPILEEAARRAAAAQAQAQRGGRGVGGWGDRVAAAAGGGGGGGGGGGSMMYSKRGPVAGAAAGGGGGGGGGGVLVGSGSGVGVDPNEPVYCYCRNVAYGEMIGCDNPNCQFEWFHYRCVGLTRQPTAGNRWLCPKCKREQANIKGGGGVGGPTNAAAVLDMLEKKE